MALLIEDGTGVVGADAYADVDDCIAWAVKYFGSSLTGSTASKEAAIRRAVFFLDNLKWEGQATYQRDRQSLAWPRASVYDREGYAIPVDEIPREIIFAQHVFARAEHQEPGVLSPQVDRSNQKILSQVGSIAWDVKGVGGVDAARPVVTMALDGIRQFLVGGGSSVLMQRG